MPLHSDCSQGVADLVELEWLDDRYDDFHGCFSPLGRSTQQRGAGRGTLVVRTLLGGALAESFQGACQAIKLSYLLDLN